MAHTPDRRKYTIVGIDPGTTVGVAMLDLDGNTVDVFSSKNYSVSDTIRLIISRGRPLVVASDVTPTPSMVKKVSNVFSSRVHELNDCLTVEEKFALTKGEGYEYKNVHERDALAACVNVFKNYKKKFAQVRKKTPPGVDVEEVKALVIKGVSISAAVEQLISERVKAEEKAEEGAGVEQAKRERAEEEVDNSVARENIRLRRLLKEKSVQIVAMKETTLALNTELAEKELEIEQLQSKLEFIKSVRSKELKEADWIRTKDSEIKRLRTELRVKERENAELNGLIAELKGLRAVKDGIRIKVIPAFNRDAIFGVDKKYGFKQGDIVFLEDGSGGGAVTAELLANKGVAAVIYGKEMSHFATQKFREYGIPAFSTKELPLLSPAWTDFAFVDPHVLNYKIAMWRSARKSDTIERFVFV